MCCIWVIAWFYLARETPKDHPRITEAEKEYIQKNIGFDTLKKVSSLIFIFQKETRSKHCKRNTQIQLNQNE